MVVLMELLLIWEVLHLAKLSIGNFKFLAGAVDCAKRLTAHLQFLE